MRLVYVYVCVFNLLYTSQLMHIHTAVLKLLLVGVSTVYPDSTDLWSQLWSEECSVHGATPMHKAAASGYIGPSVRLCTFDLWILVCDRAIPGQS